MKTSRPAEPRRDLVAGLGSSHGDDRVGWDVVDRLARLGPDVRRVKLAGALDLLDAFDGVDVAWIVDASSPEGRPGTVRRLPWPCAAFDTGGFRGSHDVPLPDALRLCEALGRLPPVVVVFAVEAGDVSPGAEPTAPVLEAAEAAADLIEIELTARPRRRKSHA